MEKLKSLVLGVALTMVGAARTPAQNLIVNGDFTANAAAFTTWPGMTGGANPAAVTGWVNVTGGGAGINGAGTGVGDVFGPTATGGRTYAFIAGGVNALRQTLPVTYIPGTTYQLNFDAAARYYNPSVSFRVQIGDATQIHFTTLVGAVELTGNNAAFNSYSYTFTSPATFAGTPVLELYNLTGGDNTINYANVSLVAMTETYLDNGVVKVGIDLAKGGSITYLSKSGTNDSVINNYDLGRQIQQSYYSGPQPYNPSNNANPNFPNWPWNPVQAGDASGHPSLVLAHTNTGQSLYVKCRPMQWALTNVPGECTFESWLTLNGNVVTVSNRLVNLRTDTTQQFVGYDQELPAALVIGRLHRIFSYAGNAPFTGDGLTNLPVQQALMSWRATESWSAMVDTNNWGLGVYHPGVIKFVGQFDGTPGSGGPTNYATDHISAVHQEVLDSNIVYTYTYSLILGTLPEIRDWVYAQPYRPACNFVFQSDRQHWFFSQTTDAGWPITNRLRVSLASSDPQMYSPPTAFPAANVPTLYIRAAYHLANPAGATGQLFWQTNNSAFSDALSQRFPIVANGQFRTYQLNLSVLNNYTGLITGLRFDPASNGQTGDYVDVAWISSSPYSNAAPVAGSDAVFAHWNTTSNLSVSNLLANDTDPDGDTLAITAVTPGTNTASVELTNSFVRYTPVAGFAGNGAFTYLLSDGQGGQATGTVSVVVVKPEITAWALLASNSFRLQFQAIPNTTYRLQTSTNLATWFELSTNSTAGDGHLQFDDSTAPSSAIRFYRFVWP